jgi:hypothetical protein
MKQKIDWGSWVSNIIALLFFGFIILFLYSVVGMIYVKKAGIPQTVVVSYYSDTHIGNGQPVKSAFGYYYVNGKRYGAFTDGNLPIGATFEIKYDPKNPSHWASVKTVVKNKK